MLEIDSGFLVKMVTTFDELSDDILIHLFQFLGGKDCMTFSLSGVSNRFSFLYGGRRTVSVCQCYSVTEELFYSYIKNWVCPEIVTCLDVSHCYWLPRDSLYDVVLSMKHLNSLHVEDTKLNLSDLSIIFKMCKQIASIGISVTENDLKAFQMIRRNGTLSSALPSLSDGFAKLTDVKILAFNSAYYIDSWCIILQLLSCCKICVDLHVEIDYSEEYFKYGPFGKNDYDEYFVNHVRDEFFPHLGWMASLKKLVILKRGGVISYDDECVKGLVNWIFSQYNMNSIERVWIKEEIQILSDAIASNNRLKSIFCGSLPDFYWSNQRSAHLEHIGGIGLGHWITPDTSSHLRYIHGYCVNSKGVDELCRNHPKLEHLLLNDNNGYPFFIKGDWKLPYLKTLVYTCSFPNAEILEYFINATPNLDALHIGYSNRSASSPYTTVNHESPSAGMTAEFLKVICCPRLTTLSLNAFELFDGEFFETVFKGCPQLKSLHICGGLTNVRCFENFGRFICLARSLRDLRLQYVNEYDELMSDQSLNILNTLLESNRLERLVLYEEDGPNTPWDDKMLQNALLDFVRRMPRLIAFCFITASDIQPTTLGELKRKFDELVLPIRPAFWYHVGQTLPRSTDPTVPRIHYNQIVSPINPSEIAPDF